MAPVNDAVTSYVVGVWRIRPLPGGKAERRGLGPVRGNCARLFDAWHEPLVIAEGIEDAIAARILLGEPAWAALSAGNMAGLSIPLHLEPITIFADNDGPGMAGASALARRLRDAGRAVRVLRASALKDPNDLLREGGGA